jgi:hypothetical protein
LYTPERKMISAKLLIDKVPQKDIPEDGFYKY